MQTSFEVTVLPAPETTPEPETTEPETTEPETTEPESESATEPAPEATEPEVTTEPEPDDKGGCGSVIASASVVLISFVALGLKKKED